MVIRVVILAKVKKNSDTFTLFIRSTPNPESAKLFTKFNAYFDLIRTFFRLKIRKFLLFHKKGSLRCSLKINKLIFERKKI